jgi:hypothetical protein
MNNEKIVPKQLDIIFPVQRKKCKLWHVSKMAQPTNYLQVTAMYKGMDQNSHFHNSIWAHH